MQNKINPRQYTPYALNTPSGNLFFEQGVDFFNVYLLDAQSGSKNHVGDFKINTGFAHYIDASNEVEFSENNAVLNTLNSVASGSNNLILNSNNSEVSGSNNTIIGGRDNQIADADYSFALGRNIDIIHTGAGVIGDGDNSTTKTSVTRDSLNIVFRSGVFVENDFYVKGDFYSTGDESYFTSNINVGSSSSGLFSGDLNVLGTAYNTGSPLQNLQNLLDQSGFLTTVINNGSGVLNTKINLASGSLSTGIVNTGTAAVNFATAISGAIKSDINSQLSYAVYITGNSVIEGTKTFTGDATILNRVTGNLFNICGPQKVAAPATYNAFGNSGDIAMEGEYLYLATGNSAWGRVQVAAW